jgi:outer membrane protein assembly factor BamB
VPKYKKMRKTNTLWLFLFWINSSFLLAQTSIESIFPLKWKTYVGQTTYRTNILLHQNKIWLGSNGNTLDKTSQDEFDAVFSIDARTGQVVQKIQPLIPNGQKKDLSDLDVNGIAIDENKLYFGIDEGYFYAYDLSQNKILWQYKTPFLENIENIGNVEGCPVVIDLNQDDENDVVFSVRGRGIVALNGKTGSPLWVQILTNDNGAFLTSPLCVDVNADNIPDVISGGWNATSIERESLLYALNGKNGEIIWKYTLGTGLKSSPILVEKGEKKAIVVASTYSVVHYIDLQGKHLYALDLNLPSGAISGLYAAVTLSPNETLAIGSSWWSGNDDGLWIAHLQKAEIEKENRYGYRIVSNKAQTFFPANRITASAVVGQINSKKSWQIAVPTEKGELLLYDENTRKLERYKIPSGSECTPLLADIDGDKKLELLIACYDGYLYCYDLPFKKAKVFSGQFRQDNRNRATLKLNKSK